MKTINLPLEVSDRFHETLGLATPEQVPDALKFLLAVKLFEEGRMSLGRAAELCGMGKIAFMEELGRRRIPVVNWDEEEIRRELSNV
jgi:predicted HTH domain antitoxin